MTKSRNPPQPPRQRSASRYKRSETSRLVKGVVDAGLTVRGIEVDPATGVLRVLTESGRGEPKEVSPLDQWKAGRGQS